MFRASTLSACFLLSALASLSTILYGTYIDGPWSSEASPFRGHPGWLTVAFTLCMPVGLLAYHLESPVSPAPTWLRRLLADRHFRRRAHALLQVTAAATAALGWYTVWNVREAKGKAHFPWGKALVKQAHIWGGYGVFALITAQVVSGVLKYRARTSARPPSRPVALWHGRVGSLTWALGMLSVVTGVWFSFVQRGFLGVGAAALVSCGAMGGFAWWILVRAPRPCVTEDSGAGGGSGSEATVQASATSASAPPVTEAAAKEDGTGARDQDELLR